jgi:molecular chaperone GrpE (heat shock protein)
MKEAFSAETAKNLYPNTKEEFENFKAQIPEEIAEAESAGNSEKVQELRGYQEEYEKILESLRVGDTAPARIKIASMIEQNVSFIKLGIPDNIVDETHGERIARLASLLEELDNPQVESDHSGQESTESSRGKAETQDTAEFEALAEQLKTAEQQLEKLLAEIRNMRARLDPLMKNARLTQLKRGIMEQ